MFALYPFNLANISNLFRATRNVFLISFFSNCRKARHREATISVWIDGDQTVLRISYKSLKFSLIKFSRTWMILIPDVYYYCTPCEPKSVEKNKLLWMGATALTLCKDEPINLLNVTIFDDHYIGWIRLPISTLDKLGSWHCDYRVSLGDI